MEDKPQKGKQKVSEAEIHSQKGQASKYGFKENIKGQGKK